MRSPRQKLGDSAEHAAAVYFQEQAVEVVAKNLRIGRFEIDLVIREGPVLIFVEVRTRGQRSWQRSLDSIDWKKQARLRRAAELLWPRRARFGRDIERIRFDAVAVVFENGHAYIEHIKAAF